MSEITDNFIKVIGTIAHNEYMSRDIWILPSVCIAQAALESGWNLEARSLFGIKGDGFTASTSEYYNGHYEEIVDSFRTYPDVASAVVGYYDFLRDTPRYVNALNNPDYRDAVDKLIHTTDGYPYATDPDYIDKIVSIIEDYDLTTYDVRDDVPDVPDVPDTPDVTDVPYADYSDEELAEAIWNGTEPFADGVPNGEDRRNALGDRYDAVQAIIENMNTEDEPDIPYADYSDEELAYAIWDGTEPFSDGVPDGDDRRDALGERYDAVMEIINEKWG